MISNLLDYSFNHRYVCYGRMSSDRQNPRSPDQQFNEIARTRDSCGYSHWTHLVSYRDDGVSGRLLKKRSGLQQMLKHIRSGQISPTLILVDTWERLGRAEEIEQIRLELKNHFGIVILTADTRFADPNTPQGRAMSAFQQIRAVDDGRIKAHNVARGKRDAVCQGHWPGGNAPLGFRLEARVYNDGRRDKLHHFLVEDPASSGVIRLLFEMARDTGWGITKLVKAMNQDPRVPEQLKLIKAPLVRGALSNPLYIGTMVYGRLSTDIVCDTRIAIKTAEKDRLVVENFCPPLVDRATFDLVQELIKQRADRHKQARMAKSGLPKAERQQIGRINGVPLKYPLSGLVRCGHCGRSMPPHAGGVYAKTGKRYTYYVCPASLTDECPNHFLVREDLLRRDVWAILKSKLFPAAAGGKDPDWISEVIEAVKTQLTHQSEQGSDHRSALARECTALEARQQGWMSSLSDPMLDRGLRRDIQQHYSEARVRVAQIQAELEALDAQREHLEDLASPEAVLDRLNRLHELMGSKNAAVLNLELSRYIQRIEVYGDGRIVVRICKLGGLPAETAQALAQLGNDKAEETPTETQAPAPFPLPRRRVQGEELPDVDLHEYNLTAPQPDLYAALGEQWFWREAYWMPVRPCWAEENAEEVAHFMNQPGASVKKAAAHFQKAPQTIRSAMKRAAAQKQRDAIMVPERQYMRPDLAVTSSSAPDGTAGWNQSDSDPLPPEASAA